jgi:hypothetical protein
VLLATFHPQLFWSRSALPNGASMFFVLVVLYLLDRSLIDGGPATLMLTGLATGLAQYFYLANRVLVPLVFVTLLAAAVTAGFSSGAWRTAASVLCKRGLLVAVGVVVAVVPLVAFFDVNPGTYNGRVNQVSLFHNGALDFEATASGRSMLGVVWHHLVESAMLPFRTVPQGFYRGGVPWVGWLIAVTAAVGVALAIARLGRPRWVALSVAYWSTVAGTATTTGPADTNRWVMAVPLICVFATIGLDGIVRVIVAHWPRTHTVVAICACTWVAVSAAWSLHFFFRDDNQVLLYSDTNTQVAEHLGRQIHDADPHATVYFSGTPRMTFHGFQDLVFRAPAADGVDVVQPWSDLTPPPTLTGTTLFIALPERAAELDIVQRWFPDGERRNVYDSHGNTLYISYTVRP